MTHRRNDWAGEWDESKEMNEWMNGRRNELMCGNELKCQNMNNWMNEWRVNKWKEEWQCGESDEEWRKWMNEWAMNERMEGRMNMKRLKENK